MHRFSKIDPGTLHAIARIAAISAGIFSFVVAVLLIANFLQSRPLDPLDNQALESLIQQLRDDPENAALREQIRTIDLLSRKALFVSQWQLRTGSYLLLAGIIVLLAALKIIDSLQPKLPHVEGTPKPEASWLLATKARQWIAGLGVFLLGTALILAFFSYRELDAGRGADGVATSGVSRSEILTNWPNFRGPDGLGIAPGATPPLGWQMDSGQGVAWRSPLPKPGLSSPIAWQDRVFVTGGDSDGLAVYAYDMAGGALLWQYQACGPGDKHFDDFEPGDYTGYAASTPATDGRRLFAIFANGRLVCIDFNGKLGWQRDLGIPDNHYGHSSSLLVHDNLLIVQYDQSSQGLLLALDVLSGETAWRLNRESISWSSPVLIDVSSRPQLIVTDSRDVDAFEPKSGVKLWSVSCLAGEHGPSPAYADGMLVVANESSEVTGIRVDDAGAEIAWYFGNDLPDAASPLLNDSLVFIPTGYGVMVCLQAKTGELLWEHRFDKGFVASPLLLGDMVYALDMSGIMHIFAAEPDFRSLGAFPLGEKASSTPAFAHGRLFIRGEKTLFCITGT